MAFAVAAGIGLARATRCGRPGRAQVADVEPKKTKTRKSAARSRSAGSCMRSQPEVRGCALYRAPPRRRRAMPRAPATMRAEPRFENYQAALRDLEHEVAEDGYEDEERRGGRGRARKRAASRALRPSRARRSSGGYALPALESPHRAEADRPRHAQPGNAADQRRPRSKACSAISACAARSSMRGRARWSRSTSWSPRPASSRRA